MTTTDRVAALYQLYLQLDELTTAEEMEAYPFLEHLADLIEDLEGGKPRLRRLNQLGGNST